MKNTWLNAEVDELVINKTENGNAPSDFFDDVWVEIDGKWYLPGNGEEALS